MIRHARSHPLRSAIRFLAAVSVAAVVVGIVGARPASAATEPDGIGVADPTTGRWWLQDPVTGATTSFYFGDPGDVPFLGDWDCDGVDTPGLYRQSDGFVYLRNSNTQGVADRTFFFGNPGDVPIVGDFDGDGCDTVSIYRPSEGRFYIINALGVDGGGLGAAEFDFVFGDVGDVPFVGDFDGDGIDTIGLQRPSTGLVFFRNDHRGGPASTSFVFGDPGDRVIAGHWSSSPDGIDTVGAFRRVQGAFYLRGDNSPGPASPPIVYGAARMVPLAGSFGTLPGGDPEPPRDVFLVSSFTTYHPCCEARVTNIHLMADAVDGAVVLPGETFSINERVGERTEEKGYVRAGAIIGGVVYCCDKQANIGGGTSQFATTFYNAVFFGGYEDVSHRPHSLYFSRYPMGREATMGYPSPDVVFRNDTLTPVTIRTRYTGTSITVEFYGNNEGRVVSTETIGRATGRDGGRVTVKRYVTYPNGVTTTESWTHTYRPNRTHEDPPEEPPADPGDGCSICQ